MKKNCGFTLLEVMMVAVILGIMASLAVVKYSATIANSELDKEAHSLYMEIRAVRSLAFKYDSWVYGKFFTDRCSIYVDTNGTETRDANDIRKVHIIRPPVTIGLPSDAPTTWPYPGWTAPTNGMTKDWEDELTIEPDSRGEYAHGGIYLKSSRLKKITYFIGIDTAMQSVEFFKWEGSSWQKR